MTPPTAPVTAETVVPALQPTTAETLVPATQPTAAETLAAAEHPLGAAARARGRTGPVLPLTPARPAAVIVPPVVVYLLYVMSVVAVESLFTGDFWFLHSVRGMTQAALMLPVVYAFRTFLRGRVGKRASRLLTPPLAALALWSMDLVLPGERLHLWTLAFAFCDALLLPAFVRTWREDWMRRRPARFTLLAASEWNAADAIGRLEVIPGLKIVNVVIPGCVPDEATRLLGLPVKAAAEEGAGFERRVIVSCPMKHPEVAGTIARLVALGHLITSESAMLRSAEGRVDTHRADPLNLILSSPRSWSLGFVSRARDLVVSAVALVVLAPVFLLVAAAIKAQDGGSVFYHQRRLGRRGKAFHVIKFRSMSVDAEQHTGPVWAQRNDPRITRLGRFLRQTRIDELPQLLNVLRGEMSLVGPRPERPHFFDVLRADVPLFELRTMLRPGITGWAQIRAPYAADPSDARTKLEYDLYYVLHRSPWFDLAILLETVGVALSGSGAR